MREGGAAHEKMSKEGQKPKKHKVSVWGALYNFHISTISLYVLLYDVHLHTSTSVFFITLSL